MSTTTERTSPAAWILIQPIRFYQRFISRYTPPSCRYYPCCSSYGIRAMRRHGAVKGLLLTAWRLLRCNPWTAGGVDHIPDRGHWRWRDPETRDRGGHAGEDVIDNPARPTVAAPTIGRYAA